MTEEVEEQFQSKVKVTGYVKNSLMMIEKLEMYENKLD